MIVSAETTLLGRGFPRTPSRRSSTGRRARSRAAWRHARGLRRSSSVPRRSGRGALPPAEPAWRGGAGAARRRPAPVRRGAAATRAGPPASPEGGQDDRVAEDGDEDHEQDEPDDQPGRRAISPRVAEPGSSGSPAGATSSLTWSARWSSSSGRSGCWAAMARLYRLVPIGAPRSELPRRGPSAACDAPVHIRRASCPGGGSGPRLMARAARPTVFVAVPIVAPLRVSSTSRRGPRCGIRFRHQPLRR